MKIGEFAKKYNIPISSIRHYINLNILMPERNGSQYNFQPNDHRDMDTVNLLKSGGFSLKEISTYINTLRFYDPNDNSKYVKLLSLLQKKESELLSKRQTLEENLQFVSEMINDYSKELTSEDINCNDGIHVDFLDYLACPKCGTHLQLENASILHSEILSGVLSCSCGYTAHIEDGFIFTDIKRDLDADSDFFDDYFGEDRGTDYDTSFFEANNNASPEYLALQYKAREWINNSIKSNIPCSRVILIPDVASQFLYLYNNQKYFNDTLIIITGLSKRSVNKMRNHLRSLNIKSKIAVIISPDCTLPLLHGCIDLLVDYLGSYSYSFYKSQPYISYVEPYLSGESFIIGSIDYFDRNSRSVQAINTTYKDSLSPMPDYIQNKRLLSEYGFTIDENELIGSCVFSGNYFEYHMSGEKRYSHGYCAKRNQSIMP